MTTNPTRAPRVRASELTGRGWLNTGGKDVTLADLRGKIVILDFWTFCCINCLHVLDELRELEERHRDEVVIVGVHSPKFVHEADPDALAAAVQRYGVAHPVLDDPQLVTWSAYTARAWPTLVVIDPEGYVVATMAGEGHAKNLEILVEELIAQHDAAGTLHRGDGPYVPPERAATTLRFPAKVVELPDGNLLVADAGHHRLTELAADGETLVRTIGTGERGRADGAPDVARFSEPNGLALVPEELRATLGYDVVVADTVNHLLRGVRLADGHVTTVAGTGEQHMVGGPDNGTGTEPLALRLSSPWDIAWSPSAAAFVVAMAGNHTLWSFDPVERALRHLAGTMHEGLVDGELRPAWFAQPSGLSADDAGLWLADAETSALRRVDLVGRFDGTVRTAVGQGLFEFGHRDGPGSEALLQHPLGVCALPDGTVAVADTYNGAVRVYDPATGEVSTLATGLAEPSGLLVVDEGTHLLVVESAAHRLTRLPLGQAGRRHDGDAHRTRRPVTEVAPSFTLRVVFTPASGQKLDDRFGPSTQLDVAASRPGVLLDGAGSGTDLERVVTLAADPAEDGTETVLSVTAKAASCDADPAVEFPACHLAAQDWGIPVRVVEGGPTELVLPLHG
ncbi:NHL domain-containing thioredoxin family protein [Georgenia thermotolerans]|uniref:Redoxin domain-containing protein n=1 Tax=Georgenia thermotolerans TaxID=527326 RepID=A0A7J5UU18_9MICO|nr:NHL domain-containing thioredoxin family protein [Georgenia thermotolerans]KAE8765779.1 redoxin domain-containing protein [Georgenia thermotolerans]